MTCRRRTGWLMALGLLATPVIVLAETIELVTYYPAPAATTDDLKVRRASVGTTYQTLNFDDPLTPVANGTLLVEGNLGAGLIAGAAPTFTGGPGGATSGLLNVQDIFLRSVGVWASEALAGGVEPTKPYTITTKLPDTDVDTAAYDVYSILQLWRFMAWREAR